MLKEMYNNHLCKLKPKGCKMSEKGCKQSATSNKNRRKTDTDRQHKNGKKWKTTIRTKRHKDDVKQKNKDNEDINCEEAKRIREIAK